VRPELGRRRPGGHSGAVSRDARAGVPSAASAASAGGDWQFDPVAAIAAGVPADVYDGFLVDLDGVLFRGSIPIAGAAQALTRLRRLAPVRLVTNNAFRTPEQVRAHLARLGFDVAADEITTAAQAVGWALVEQLGPGDGRRVLVVGGDGLRAAVAAAGFEVLRPKDAQHHDVVAVAQGFTPDTSWRELAAAGYALADPQVAWVAANLDLTLPTDRGIAPGNGALVDVVAQACGRRPLSVGKPAPGLFARAMASMDSLRPLVVGDRQDTDIAAAAAAGLDSVLVLTGVSTASAAGRAGPAERPTFVVSSIADLG
jgi:glycerol 3-phosphatase-2